MFLFTSAHLLTKNSLKTGDYRKVHFISVRTKLKYDKPVFVLQKTCFFGLKVKKTFYTDFKLGSKVGLLMISVLRYSLVYCCLTLKAGVYGVIIVKNLVSCIVFLTKSCSHQ